MSGDNLFDNFNVKETNETLVITYFGQTFISIRKSALQKFANSLSVNKKGEVLSIESVEVYETLQFLDIFYTEFEKRMGYPARKVKPNSKEYQTAINIIRKSKRLGVEPKVFLNHACNIFTSWLSKNPYTSFNLGYVDTNLVYDKIAGKIKSEKCGPVIGLVGMTTKQQKDKVFEISRRLIDGTATLNELKFATAYFRSINKDVPSAITVELERLEKEINGKDN